MGRKNVFIQHLQFYVQFVSLLNASNRNTNHHNLFKSNYIYIFLNLAPAINHFLKLGMSKFRFVRTLWFLLFLTLFYEKYNENGWEFEIDTFEILLKNSVDFDFLISKLNKIIIQWFRKVKINFDTETQFRHPNKNFDFKTKITFGKFFSFEKINQSIKINNAIQAVLSVNKILPNFFNKFKLVQSILNKNCGIKKELAD
ncbi:hypothetical protein BpHYR1_003927 [Brachionus plicatilis]|uniref:Uncharacterized protein n=1 Tax=Brachionus plicatilis TaxID=10195 RepID=A0A3M7QAN4_BRAPC|nr:hypothetical protein BpHYR1_003927 [Brachionus plicatilis]